MHCIQYHTIPFAFHNSILHTREYAEHLRCMKRQQPAGDASRSWLMNSARRRHACSTRARRTHRSTCSESRHRACTSCSCLCARTADALARAAGHLPSGAYARRPGGLPSPPLAMQAGRAAEPPARPGGKTAKNGERAQRPPAGTTANTPELGRPRVSPHVTSAQPAGYFGARGGLDWQLARCYYKSRRVPVCQWAC